MHKHFILRSTLLVVGISLAVKVLGYVEKVLLAYHYGTGIEADGYLVVSGVLLSCFFFMRELIEPGFLPTFMGLRQKGDQEGAWRFFSMTGLLVLAIMAIPSLFILLFPKLVLTVAAPGFSGEQADFSIQLLRWVGPGVIFLAGSTLAYITLTSFKRFFLPALSDFLMKGGLVLCLYLFGGKSALLALGAGMLLGAVLRFAILFFPLAPNIRLRGLGFNIAGMRKMGRLTLPIAGGVVFAQLSVLVDNQVASLMEEGAVAALGYAKKVVDMPVVVLPYALSIVIFPFFTELNLQKNRERLLILFGNAFQWILALFIPLAVLTFVLAGPVVSLLFERGAFDAASTAMTISPLQFYALGMPAFAIETILVLLYFALEDTRTPILVGILAVVLDIALAYAFSHAFGYTGVAAALVIAKTLKVAVLLYLLRNKFQLDFRKLAGQALRWGAATLLVGGLLAGLMQVLTFPSGGGLKQYLLPGGLAAGGLILFFGSLWLLGIRLPLGGWGIKTEGDDGED